MKTVLRLLFWIMLVVTICLGIKTYKRYRRNRLIIHDQAVDVANVNNAWVKVSGVTFNGRQRLLEQLSTKETLRLIRVPLEGHPEGVGVINLAGTMLGYVTVDKDMAVSVSRLMDAGIHVSVTDWERVGMETDKPRLGLRMKLRVHTGNGNGEAHANGTGGNQGNGG